MEGTTLNRMLPLQNQFQVEEVGQEKLTQEEEEQFYREFTEKFIKFIKVSSSSPYLRSKENLFILKKLPLISSLLLRKLWKKLEASSSTTFSMASLTSAESTST